MHFPKMVLFDYGGTLCEGNYTSNRLFDGFSALMEHVVKNPHGYSAEYVMKIADGIDAGFRELSQSGYELSIPMRQKLLFEPLGIKLSLSPLEMETVFWDGYMQQRLKDGVSEMIDYLNEAGIRTGIISNNGYTGEALKRLFDRLLPQNRFELILSSADYFYKKPHRTMFEAAIGLSSLAPRDIFYCGDSIDADCIGSGAVGMFPVLYDQSGEETADSAREKSGYECLVIHHWNDLVDYLRKNQ